MAPYHNRMNVFVQSVQTKSDGSVSLGKPKQLTFETERSISGYLWKGESRIIFCRDNGGDENYQLFGVKVDGGDIKAYTPFPGVKTQLLNSLELCPNEILIGLNKRNPECFDPYRLNLESGELTMLFENPGNLQGWTTDYEGKLRAVYAMLDGGKSTLLYRDDEEQDFESVITLDFEDDLALHFFSSDNIEVYATTNINRDRTAIVKINPRTCEELEVIYEDDRYDVSAVAYSRLRKRLLAVFCSGHQSPVRYWLNEEERLFREHLDSRFPNMRVSVIDNNNSEQRFLLLVWNDRTPGSYWIYDKPTDAFLFIGDKAPWITSEDTVQMKPVSYTTRDGLTIEAYVSMPRNAKAPVPMVINPHGGPYSRDYWGYSPLVQFLCSRGYGVFQLNFRGSTGYGRSFLQAGYKQWGLKMQDDITDAVHWLVQEGYADPKRVAIYGASYGGYAALAGICFTPDLYCCAVDFVGVSNLLTLLGNVPPYWRMALELMYRQIGHPVHDREQLEATSPALHADTIRCPLFIAQGANDPRVRKSESDQMVEALRKRGISVEYMVKENEGHGFSNQENRFDFYRAMISFLNKHMKPDSVVLES